MFLRITHLDTENEMGCIAEPDSSASEQRNAPTSFTDDQMHAALDINILNYTTAIVTADEVVDLISSPQALSRKAD
jgi:ureidoacrylate peracid hydrolase